VNPETQNANANANTVLRFTSRRSHRPPLLSVGLFASSEGSGSQEEATRDGSSTQRKSITGGSNPRSATSVKSEANGGCWEINGCEGPTVDTDYGCKSLPKGPLPCVGQCCTMAWAFNDNRQIVLGTEGRFFVPAGRWRSTVFPPTLSIALSITSSLSPSLHRSLHRSLHHFIARCHSSNNIITAIVMVVHTQPRASYKSVALT
jgi:hypothetical protein